MENFLKRVEWYVLKFSASLKSSSYQLFVKKEEGECFKPDFAYLCPLCVKEHIVYLSDEKLLNWNEDFDLDHFPPKSAGGKHTVLVCKKCNSTYGLDIDHMVVEFLKFDAFSKKIENAKINALSTFKGTKGKYPINLGLYKDGSIRFELPKKPMPFVNDWLNEAKTNSNWEIQISFNGPSNNKFQKSLLKSAYLYSFMTWGYDFIFSKTGNKIREVLQGSESHPLANFGVFVSFNDTDFQNGIILSNNSSIYNGFIVNFEIIEKETGHKGYVSVLIPGNDSNSWDDLKLIQEQIDNKKVFTIGGIKMNEDFKKPIIGKPFTKDWDDYKNNNLRFK